MTIRLMDALCHNCAKSTRDDSIIQMIIDVMHSVNEIRWKQRWAFIALFRIICFISII